MGGGKYNRRTVEEVFRDLEGRRAGMIRALTTDVVEFYHQCDPESTKNANAMPAKDKEDLEEEEEEEAEEHGDTLCGACGENYASDEFWICCDVCEKWFHDNCVKINPVRAKHIKQYKCTSCSNKRARP